MTDSPEAQAASSPSSLFVYLPAIYREEPFLGGFLVAFEQLLFGLEWTVADIASCFRPRARDGEVGEAPAQFLRWLASWTAFSLRFDLDETQQRDFIARIIPLYRHRGTKQNLEDLLSIFTIGRPTITEAASAAALRFGRHSTVGLDTLLGIAEEDQDGGHQAA